MAAPDRKIALLGQNVVTGIDFVYVDATQTQLDVYFLRDPLTITVPLNSLVADQVLIYNAERNEPAQEVGIVSLTWITIGGDNVLRIQTDAPGDFTLYRFTLDDGRVDRYFNHLILDFKANCPSDRDCKTPPHECAPEDWVDFPIDYQARDFDSFRQALLDFASLKYPHWTDRLEADAGVMLLEVMSALGDEMAYYQDRVGREAHLETATQRRSVRRHARLIDYHMHDGLGASTWLDVTVETGAGFGDIPAGSDVWALSDTGTQVMFEVGTSLAEILETPTVNYRVYEDRNEFTPHSWDEDDVCLTAGSTEIYIVGHHAATLLPGGNLNADQLILKTLASPGVPSKTHLIHLLTATDEVDPVFGTQITRLTWPDEDATPFEMDLEVLVVRGNIVPIIAGQSFTERFIVGEDPDPVAMSDPFYGTLTRALERGGPGDVPIYLFSLTDSDITPLVWEGEKPELATPAIEIRQASFSTPNWTAASTPGWDWKLSLLGSPSSLPQERDYTLDDGMWRRVVGYQRPQGMVIHQDYATGAGKTVRFGDGEFGLIPAEGTIFQVDYRLGNGVAGNVEAETILNFDSASLTFIEAVSNPFAVTNGQEEESMSDTKTLATEAFRAVTYRAVRKEDYAEAAERLDWVQKAGAEFRWTGSWLTGFVTPDPYKETNLSEEHALDLGRQMERFRQAGREVYVTEPVYADLDLEMDICLDQDAFPAEVKARILVAMFGKGGPRPTVGYFSPDRFTFGTPLLRSTLEATVQMVPGVKAVERIRIRRRGWFQMREFAEYAYHPGKGVIIRVNNDPLHPEQGTLKLLTHGGA